MYSSKKTATLLAFFLLAGISSGYALPQQPKNFAKRIRTITVTGECLTRVVPDRGAVTVASTIVAKKPKEASEKTIAAHEAIKAEVMKLGLRDSVVETAGYSVIEECSYEGAKRSCGGFRARLATRFETSDISQIGEIISVASRLGAEEVAELQTFVSPQLMQREREGCLEVATRNARAKGEKIASGAGVALGGVQSIGEEVPSGGPVWSMATRVAPMALAGGDAAPEASVDARPVDVKVVVTAMFGIK